MEDKLLNKIKEELQIFKKNYKNTDEMFKAFLIDEVKNNGIRDDSFVDEYCNKIPQNAKEYCLNNNVSVYDIDRYLHIINIFEDIDFMNAIELCLICWRSYDIDAFEITSTNDIVDMLKLNQDL